MANIQQPKKVFILTQDKFDWLMSTLHELSFANEDAKVLAADLYLQSTASPADKPIIL